MVTLRKERDALTLMESFFIHSFFCLFLCIKLLVNPLSGQAFGASSRCWVAVPGKSLSRIPHYHQQPCTGRKCQVCCLIISITFIKPGLYHHNSLVNFIYLLSFANSWQSRRNSACRQLLRVRNSPSSGLRSSRHLRNRHQEVDSPPTNTSEIIVTM